MSWWLNWLALLVALIILFVVWSWVPLQQLDRYWRANNAFGRPLLHTLVLTGLPAIYARVMDTPAAWLLVPITFLLTQYAVLSGRFLEQQMFVAGWVMVVTTCAIWAAFWLL
jgi:hypothetical protein